MAIGSGTRIGFNSFKGRDKSINIKIKGLVSLRKSFDKLSSKTDFFPD